MKSFKDKDVESVYLAYPHKPRQQLLSLRALIYQCAEEEPAIGEITEALKWRQPSFLAQHASTVRIDWDSSANTVNVYFHCQSQLVETFRELYSEEFVFKGNRAIVLSPDHALPVDALKHCIKLALRYHQLKHLPLLGG